MCIEVNIFSIKGCEFRYTKSCRKYTLHKRKISFSYNCTSIRLREVSFKFFRAERLNLWYTYRGGMLNRNLVSVMVLFHEVTVQYRLMEAERDDGSDTQLMDMRYL
jgi:hypothetical protein